MSQRKVTAMGALEDRKSLELVYEMLKVLSDVSPSMPLQQASCFVVTALNEGASLKDLIEIVGANQATMTRHMLDLGRRNRRHEEGYKLIDSRQDDYDMRKNQYVLTVKGRGLVERLIKGVRKYADIR